VAEASPILTSFNGGIFSPLLEGHIDAPRRATSYADSTNLIALKQGPLVRRGGSVWVSEERLLSDSRVKLIEFIFNDKQAYVITFTDISFRFYRNDILVFDSSKDQTVTVITASSPPIVTVTDATGYSGNIVQLSGLSEAVELNDRKFIALNVTATTFELFDFDSITPIAAPAVAESSSTGLAEVGFSLLVPYLLESDLFDSNGLFIPDVVQSNDVMYIVHPDFTVRVLARTADDAWTITKLRFDNGPFQTQNFSDVIFTVANVSLRVWSVTVSSGDEVNIFNATQGNPVLIQTTPEHELSSSDKIFIKNVAGMTELNGNTYNITKITSTTFTLQDPDTDVNIDGTGFGAYTSGGTVEKSVAVVIPSDTLDTASGGDANNLGTATESNRLIRIQHASGSDELWKWGRITKYINTVQFEVTIDNDAKDLIAIPAGTTEWALGAYSDTTGYPSVASIHEGRLVFGATSSEPRRIDFSAIAGFNPVSTNFISSDEEGTVRPDDSIGVTIGGGSANPIAWIESISEGLAVGTIASEGLIGSSKNSESLTPTNATYKKSSTAGSIGIQPLAVKSALIHVQFIRRRLQELIFSFDRNGFQSFDMTELAEHLTRTGIVDIAYQQQPIETIWVVTSDGVLIGFTYERNADVLGWHRHVIGGTDVDVNSIAVIPSSDLSRDELWLIVTRTISGLTTKTKTYIERMERFYEDDIIQEHAYHQDAGRIYRTTEIVVSGATQADPVVVTTATNHGRSNGDNVYIRAVKGMTQLNGNTYEVASVTATTAELKNPTTSVDVDGTGFDAYISGGTLQESVAQFRALDPLEGETVQVYVDGRTHADKVVANGLVTLDDGRTGANVSIGLPNEWTFKSHRIETGSALVSSQGKIKRISQVIFRLFKTLGFQYGPDLDGILDEEPFTYGTDPDSMTPLFTGDLQVDWPGSHETAGRVTAKGTGPFPAQIQSIVPQIKVSDKPR
jgi:hypothetical protein